MGHGHVRILLQDHTTVSECVYCKNNVFSLYVNLRGDGTWSIKDELEMYIFSLGTCHKT